MRWRDVKQNKIDKKESTDTKKSLIPYASITSKIRAFITDSFLLSMPIFYVVIYLIFDGLRGELGVESNRLLTWVYVFAPLGLIVSSFYTIAGQTPGMKAYEIKVIGNLTGKKPNIILSVLRFVFFNIVFFSVIGLFVSFFREDKRGLHDLLSGTSVIDAK